MAIATSSISEGVVPVESVDECCVGCSKIRLAGLGERVFL